MAADDLNAPLGQHKDKNEDLRPRRIGVPQLLAALLAASGMVVAVWAAFAFRPSRPVGG